MSNVVSSKSKLEILARRMYDETADFYAQVSPQMGAAALGYKILYGPPQVGIRVLFLGSQPGGNLNDALAGDFIGERITWPEQFEYSASSWGLAHRAREIWHPDLLMRSTAMNANFFRSPNHKTWKLVDRELRLEVEIFCLLRARELAIAHEAQEIVVIGITLFDQLKDKKALTRTHESNRTPQGRLDRLVVEGEIWGIPAKGVKHLTGQYTTPNDRAKIREFFEKL
jgi:hypothetical protein